MALSPYTLIQYRLLFKVFVTYGCDSICSSEEEDVGVESRDKEQGEPLEVEEESEWAVEWSPQLDPQLRGVEEIFMVKAE